MLDACGVILGTNRRPQRPSQSLAEMSSSSCGEVVKRHVKVHVDDDGDYGVSSSSGALRALLKIFDKPHFCRDEVDKAVCL